MDNRNTKSPAGTPLFLRKESITGLTVQGTAVIFISPLQLSYGPAIGHLNRGFNVKDEFELSILSPVISILQVRARNQGDF